MAAVLLADSKVCPTCNGFLQVPDGIRIQCHCAPGPRATHENPTQLAVAPSAALHDASAPQKPPMFPRFTAAEYARRPAPIYVVDGLLATNTTGAIVAPRGEFKTFVARDLGLSVATGRNFLGRKTRQGRVLYILGEGGDGFGLRLRAWAKGHHTDLPDAFEIIPTAVQLCQETQIDLLLATIADMPEPPAVVLIDTYNRATVGMDENAAQDTGLAVAALDRIRVSTGATVVILHHPAKAGGIRGSSALESALDTIIAIEKTGELSAVVTCVKQKDCPEFAPIHIQGKSIPLDDLKTTSLIFELSASSDGDFGPMTNTVGAVLAELKGLGPSSVSASQWQKACLAEGISERSFFRARKTLLSLELITVEPDGKRQRYLAVPEGPKEWKEGEVNRENFSLWAEQERQRQTEEDF
jgi:hypothetical protein